MTWILNSIWFLFLLVAFFYICDYNYNQFHFSQSPALPISMYIKEYSFKPNKKYVEFDLVIFRNEAGVTFYNSSTNFLTNAIVSLREHVLGEIKLKDSDVYEKAFSTANTRCAPENRNPFTSFVDKILAADVQKYVSNNFTICPFRKGVFNISNFPLLTAYIPDMFKNVKFHGLIRSIVKLKGSKKPIETNRIEFYGENY